ncbi:MAG: hypothetical protein JOS17DRAFT_795727 [Linnemannia elongata]|nr:MAG: hypothetical protein JOS17DRAFT_795727 [Linnemannia elongata]
MSSAPVYPSHPEGGPEGASPYSQQQQQPQVTFPTPPSPDQQLQQQQHLQPQFQVVSEYNLATSDQGSQVDPSSSTHLQYLPVPQPQQHQQHQQQHQQHHHDQNLESHTYQRHSAEDEGDQLHTLTETPHHTTDTTPHSDNALAKTNTTSTVGTTSPAAEYTKAKLFRRRVMRMATVPRLQLLWGLLALFGTMAWLSMMPAYAFRNKLEPVPPANATYTFFLVATVGTTIAALWQSLCPFLIRQSQRQLLPRIINHPVTQSTTIAISVILTVLNFFSWIILASNKSGGAKTNCKESPYPASQSSGYTTQCRGVNTAIVLNVVVFLLWIPIAAVIVCGTIERGLWWWGEDDGWAQQPQQGTLVKGGVNMMSEEEFDLKIGLGNGNKARGGNRSHSRLSYYADEEEEAMESRPAFVTPIASHFRTSTDEEARVQGDLAQASPSSYRQHHQRRQQQQQQQQVRPQQDQDQVVMIPRGSPAAGAGAGGRGLVRKGSTNSVAPSISARLSTFFGQGWNSGPMPPPAAPVAPAPAAPVPAHHRPVRIKMTKPEGEEEEEDNGGNGGDKASLHGDSYTTQWHNRRYDEWS